MLANVDKNYSISDIEQATYIRATDIMFTFNEF